MAEHDDGKVTAADEEQMSFDVILSGEAGSVAEEQLGLDEREKLADLRAAREQESPPEAPEKPADTAPAIEVADDVPGFLRDKPEDADNWRQLRGIAKDAQRAAKEALEAKAQLEADVALLRQQQAVASVPQPEPVKLPPADEDPGAHIQALRESIDQQMRTMRYDMSEQQAIGTHGAEKVAAAEKWYQAESQRDPGLSQLVDANPHPWQALIAEMDRRQAIAELGPDPTKYRERILEQEREKMRAEIRAELEQEQAGKVENAIRQRIPTSLATVPAAGNSSAPPWTGPATMGQVLDSGLDS